MNDDWEDLPEDAQLPEAAPTLVGSTHTQPVGELVYGSVDEFVREYLRHVYKRPINARHRYWAAEWWRYDEAVIRLEALWRAWEHLRQDPGLGMSVWWRDHADHHMPVLMDPDGPFGGVEGDENVCRRGESLPYKEPPVDLFPDVRPLAARHVDG
jgi:hypothetical protein